jgi:hypothetical protein
MELRGNGINRSASPVSQSQDGPEGGSLSHCALAYEGLLHPPFAELRLRSTLCHEQTFQWEFKDAATAKRYEPEAVTTERHV